MGNLRSVRRAFEREGAAVTVSGDPDVIATADRVVVPGQGGFGDFAAALSGGLGDALTEHIARDRPFLGICLGLQILFERSEEAPGAVGLGVFEGSVDRLPHDRPDPDEPGRRLKVPHMGWNAVVGQHALLGEGAEPAHYYFVHSYECRPADEELVVGRADYGAPVCAAVARGALFASQFHPEKSGRDGAALIRRFLTGEP